MIDCPTLIAQIREKRVEQHMAMQNIRMMRSKPREEDPNVNMMLRSGAATREDKWKLTKDSARVCKETYLEARKSFMEVSIPGSKDPPQPERDPSMLTTFLETCMKFLHDNRAVKGLQELITRYVGSSEHHMVQKLGKHASRIGLEMRLTAQIGNYEMDQIILDLGLDENVLPKQTWECMGKPTLQWSPIQLWMVNQQKILPMGRLQGITIDIEGTST